MEPIHRLLDGLPADRSWPDVLAAGSTPSPSARRPPRSAGLPRRAARPGLRRPPTARPRCCAPAPTRFAGVRDLDSARLEHALADVPHVRALPARGRQRARRAAPAARRKPRVLIRPVSIAEIERTAHEGLLMPPEVDVLHPQAAHRAGAALARREPGGRCQAQSTVQVPLERSSAAEVTGTLALRGGDELLADAGAVVRPLDGAEDADRASASGRRVDSRARANARLGSSRWASWTRMASSPDVGHLDDAQLPVGAHHHAPVAVGAEADRLAVHERDQHLLAALPAGDVLERAVVEDVAVLEDLDERRAAVGVRRPGTSRSCACGRGRGCGRRTWPRRRARPPAG